MDDSNEDNLETNWVFVEEVDIAEEALTLNPSNENLFTEIDNSSGSSFENISKSCSDSQLLPHEDNYKSLDKQNIDHDSESDGLSIISNWSYSQSTPDIENSDDGVDDKITDETLIGLIEEKQFFDEKMESNDEEIPHVSEQGTNCVDEGIDETQHARSYLDVIVNDDNSYNLVEEIQDSDHEASDQDEAEALKENEDEEPLIYPDRSFPSSSGEPIFHYDPDLLEQLRWLEELPDDLPDNANENILKKYLMSKIPQCVKKHFSVSGFLIGTVLIAASSIFLGTYFTASEPIQEELPSYQEKVFLYDVPGEENFEVPTALSFCREKHKSDDIYMEINAQKCLSKIEKRMKRKKYEKIVKEKIKSWEQQLEVKEKFLTKKEKSLRKRQFSSNENYDSNHHRTNIRKCNEDISKQKSRKHNEHKKHKDDSKEKSYKDNDKKEDKYLTVDDFKLKQSEYKTKERKYKGDSKEKKYKDDDKNGDKYSTSDDFKHKQSEHKSKERKYKDDSKEKKFKDDIEHKEFEYKSKERKYKDDSKEQDNKKGDEFSTVDNIKQKQFESTNKEKKYKNDSKEKIYKENIRKDKKHKKTDYYKKSKDIQHANKIKSNQYNEFSPKESSKEEKTRTSKENSCRSKTECKNSKNKYKQKLSPIVLVDKKNDTVDGNWLGKLFKGRSEIRGKESIGEWYFDRSSYRKRKRDKAKWYFDWMMDREILRYRRLYLNL